MLAPLLVVTTVATTPGSASVEATSEPASGETYTNPVYPRDFPDPHAIRVGDTYFAYSTNTGTSYVPVIRSTDLVSWERSVTPCRRSPRGLGSTSATPGRPG